MASCREQLRDTGGVEASFRKSEGGAETSTTGTHNNGVIFVVLHEVSYSECVASWSRHRTMTGYLDAIGPVASFARSGCEPKIRASRVGQLVTANTELAKRIEVAYRPVLSRKRDVSDFAERVKSISQAVV